MNHLFPLMNNPDKGTVMLPRNLVDDIIMELSICHGLYCTDREEVVKEINDDLWFRMDETQIIEEIRKHIM